ncbi:MAG: type IIA DNA topoisomerase subunit B, partial [Muribaculaceae bacterium]|nr:type IIA DNA topoisomerase subunit B [Muribaculaceae bacterium]
AFKDAVSRTIKEYFGKNVDPSDIRSGMIAAVAIKVEEPVFESQTKTKLGSRDMGPDGPTVSKFIGDFIKRELDNFLHRNADNVAKSMLEKIQKNEQERKAIAGVAKIAREKAKKVSINNKKLFDCRVHLSDAKGDDALKYASSLFITEGDSATGSITKIRDVNTQAVFSLRGKPLNTYGLTRKVVYTNDEFNLLQAALNIEDGIENLRYNNVIIATDADVDGMHIRLLLITFFLQFFPDLIKQGHVYVLQTPLFRVRNKLTSKRSGRKAKSDEDTYYCYTDQERISAIERLGSNAEITRFKGLGEISPDEFREFIGENMRLDRVTLKKEYGVDELLEFYMGQTTM